jgi:hypothetical protein
MQISMPPQLASAAGVAVEELRAHPAQGAVERAASVASVTSVRQARRRLGHLGQRFGCG